MKNRPLKREVLTQLRRLTEARDTNEAVMMIITQLSHHYMNAMLCYEKLEKYEKHPIIRALKKLIRV